MNYDTPQWLKQRQVRVEELPGGQLKLTGPNLPESVVGIRLGESLRWSAYFRSKADGPDVEATAEEFVRPRDAVNAAFELYRGHVIV